MSNKVIHDMIEAIEHFAQVQPDFPVYDILGQVHTYGDLKKDSDSLAAQLIVWDFLTSLLLWSLAVRNTKCWLLLWP